MDEAKVTSAILKHIENNFDTTELDGWRVDFEGIEDDDGNLIQYLKHKIKKMVGVVLLSPKWMMEVNFM